MSSEAADKPFKPSARQLEQKRRVYNSEFASYDVQLKDPLEHPDKWGRSITFEFNASDVEFYDLLGVTGPGNAVRILYRGIRNSADAVKYMRQAGAAHAIVDNRELFQGALKRRIPVHRIIALLHTIDYGSSYALDALEMASSAALVSQFPSVRQDVLEGTIRLADVKALGVAKLKSHSRLSDTSIALRRVNEPDQAFSLKDLKSVVDRAAKEGASHEVYSRVVRYLVDRGMGVLDEVRSLDAFYWVAIESPKGDDRHERTEYACRFREEYDHARNGHVTHNDIMALRDAGADPREAARLRNDGLSSNAVIAILTEGTEKPLAEGWL